MSDNTVNNISLYTYGSPRYNATRAYVGNKIPNDYGYHDGLNGTYDKWFPLYRLTRTEQPVMELINADSQSNEIKGTLALKPVQTRYITQEYGAIKKGREQPFNSNLELQKVSYSNWSGIKLNPAWMTIQNKIDLSIPNKTIYIPVILVRILGNEAVTREVHAIPLDSKQTWSNYEFPTGIIVQYKKRIWRCAQKTRSYPPDTNTSNTWWELYKSQVNVFYADLFSLSEDGNSAYMTQVNDESRKFNPLQAGDDLVCWNLAYYHST